MAVFAFSIISLDLIKHDGQLGSSSSLRPKATPLLLLPNEKVWHPHTAHGFVPYTLFTLVSLRLQVDTPLVTLWRERACHFCGLLSTTSSHSMGQGPRVSRGWIGQSRRGPPKNKPCLQPRKQCSRRCACVVRCFWFLWGVQGVYCGCVLGGTKCASPRTHRVG